MNNPNPNIIEIATTTVGSCHRARQYQIRGGIEPALPHFSGIKGKIMHSIIEDGFKLNKEFDYTILKNELHITPDMEPKLTWHLKRAEDNFYKWFQTTNIDLSPGMILGAELYLSTFIRRKGIYDYFIRADLDLISRTHIIDFKGSRRSYAVQMKRQLGSYRDRAHENGLASETLDGDWQLVNVFLGGKEPKEVEYDVKMIERNIMPKFYEDLGNDIETDYLIRSNPEYIAPCKISFSCVFCDFRCVCRGI